MITIEDIEARIAAEHYWVVPGDAVVVCALTLTNDYTVIGHAGVVNPANFDVEIGKRIARQDAFHELIPLLGYEAATQRKAALEPVDGLNGLA